MGNRSDHRRGRLPAICMRIERSAFDGRKSGAVPTSSAPVAPAPKPADYGNRYSADLVARRPGEQALLLARVVKSSDEMCPVGSDAKFKGHDGNLAFWVVSCG